MPVGFTTSRKSLWKTDARRCHINWVVSDSDWESQFCLVAEEHPRVRAYVKNHGLSLEVPYRMGSEARTYIPDFIVRVDDGRGADDPLHLIVEIKGYRGEDAKDKKATMDTYWVPGVNVLGFDIDHVAWRLDLATLDPEPLTPTRPGVGLLSAPHTWIGRTP